jgi:hypothetical protein
MPPPAPNRVRVERFKWNRHYFRDRSSLGKVRWWACVAAAVVGVGWGLYALAFPGETIHHQVSHGPVASPHQAWDQRCDACHASHSLGDFSVTGAIFSSNVHQRWNEFNCQNCHAGKPDVKDYAPHHASALWKAGSEALECAACHHDHQGRDFSMVKMPDTDCTQCHKDLKDHHRDGSSRFDNKITRFEDQHPDFDAKKNFQRTLHFNHAHHMMAGIPPTPEATQNVKDGLQSNSVQKVGDLPAQFRERYRLEGQSDKDPVQLTCASCHQLDAGRTEAGQPTSKAWQATENLARNLPLDSVLPPRAAGAYYLAINYDVSCQACHPIEVAVGEKGRKPSVFTVPHRLTPEQADKQLRLAVIDGLASQTNAPPSVLKNTRDRLDPLAPERPWHNLEEQVRALTDEAKKQLLLDGPNGLYGRSCAKCHIKQPGAEALAIKPVTTPAVWLPHAKFNHSAHRAMNCASCHTSKEAKVSSLEELLSAIPKPEPVGIPDIANCRQCHAPARRTSAGPQGGVRHDCVECHRYHNGDAPLQGLGSAHRDPPDSLRLGADAFLRGTPPNRNSP